MSTDSNFSTLINKGLLQKALQNYENDTKLKVRDFSMTSATDKGDNYTSDIFRVNVNYLLNGKNEAKSLVIKVAPSEGMQKQMV